ncbi:MAG: NAD-dependent epimerase/dehydratase family protein [Lachnospiraceae bacterium]|nr:NAD-dependent epimerase/dehydratase family protein [Lachnospiraceae bacterium]
MTVKRVWSSDAALQEDLERIAGADTINWERFRGKRVLVTGATGLIGSIAARALVCAIVEYALDLKVVALGRSVVKGRAKLGAFVEDGLELVCGDILSPIVVDGPVNFILHGASVTASKTFVDQPVETILTTFEGTRNLLELAKEKQVESMVYFSSMEIYGTPDPEHYAEIPSQKALKEDGQSAERGRTAAIMRETDYGYIDPLQPRSSYSEGKRIAEGLCAAYAHEYGVPVKSVRLAQTFGAGIPKSENRVFAQFARSILEGRDIVLHTDGSKAHCYCYTTDAVLGILTVLLRGTNGEAYNISNEETYCTIREMAEMLIARYPKSGSRLVFDIPEDANAYGYAPSSRMLICSEKARGLGWKAEVALPEMFERLMRSMTGGRTVSEE